MMVGRRELVPPGGTVSRSLEDVPHGAGVRLVAAKSLAAITGVCLAQHNTTAARITTPGRSPSTTSARTLRASNSVDLGRGAGVVQGDGGDDVGRVGLENCRGRGSHLIEGVD